MGESGGVTRTRSPDMERYQTGPTGTDFSLCISDSETEGNTTTAFRTEELSGQTELRAEERNERIRKHTELSRGQRKAQ